MASAPEATTQGEVQSKLANALRLCRRIAGIAASSSGVALSATAALPPRHAARPPSPGARAALNRSVSSTSSGLVALQQLGATGTDPFRVHRGLCTRAVFRAQHLLPILERLNSVSASVAVDSRSPFVIFRLEEELRELLSLLTDCAKRAGLASLLSIRKRGLADRLAACLQEIRQCHTECLILLGGDSRHSSLGGPNDPLSFPELSIPSSPMVDKSPRAVEGFTGRLDAARKFFMRTQSDKELEAAAGNFPLVVQSARPVSTRPLIPLPDPLYSCLIPQVDDSLHLQPQLESDLQGPLAQAQARAQAGAFSAVGGDESPAAEGRPGGERHQSTPETAVEVDEATVRVLVSALSLGSAADKSAALQSLLKISEASDAGKLRVAAAGAVPALSVLLALDNEAVKLSAAGVLLHLSWLDENRIVIAKAGCVPSLVKLLRSGNPQSRTLAARVLWNLAINMDNKVIIGATEAIPSLVAIIQSDSEPAAKREAAEALVQLTANNPSNQKAVAEAGAIPSLVGMLREGGANEQDKAAFALGMLAVNNDDNKLTIAGSGATPLLLDLLRSSHPMTAKSASWCLYVLSSHTISAAYIRASGGLQRVQAALNSGPPEAKYWAGYILSLLEPGSGPPEKSVAHRYICQPSAKAQEDSPRETMQRREERERMFAR